MFLNFITINWYPVIGFSGPVLETVAAKSSNLHSYSTHCSVGEVAGDAPVQGLGPPSSDGFVDLNKGVVKFQLSYRHPVNFV